MGRINQLTPTTIVTTDSVIAVDAANGGVTNKLTINTLAGGLRVIGNYATQTQLAAKQDVLTFDDAPEEDSDNPVKSKGLVNSVPVDEVTSNNMHSVTSNAVFNITENNMIIGAQITVSMDLSSTGVKYVDFTAAPNTYKGKTLRGYMQRVSTYRVCPLGVGSDRFYYQVFVTLTGTTTAELFPVYGQKKNTTYAYQKTAMTSTWVENACLKQ